jgi:Cysteine rich repeat
MIMGRLQVICGLVVVALLTFASAVRADTMSYADAVSALADKCGADIKRHCAGVSLANNQIQACLQQHQAEVSPACASTLDTVVTSIRVRQEAQLSYFKVCAGHAARSCKGVKGDGNILGCLLKTKRIDGDKCNQAITDAGWR